ncbi:DUF4202 domain-containing protein [Thalassotalea sp. ND16A]|uniref:DUF4202 domain-containing protein n=1 Tax=Thalassotalea sp. ND16A TaxID=1535422 RepID=UPI00051A6476|nr:DUF4202 domain-containing protein [Thalassotalea sp. ND16A]KGJ87868.1 hypothetical protein ND16A_2782 [Thalassotalea sp. ND16A]
MDTETFNQAIQLIDQANAADPNKETWQGDEYSKEVLYSMRMSEALASFAPEAEQALQIAARCQHICRWQYPRSNYEMNRQGYLLWRQELKKFHAKKAAEILVSVGCKAEIIEQVEFLVLKKQLKRNPQTQILEDVICLVFLQYYFDDFIAKHSEEKLISVLQKTWAKMSEQGHQAALGLSLSAAANALVAKALS